MLVNYWKTTIREQGCGLVMLMLADFMFLYLPKEKIDIIDFIYLNVILIAAFLAFWLAGYCVFYFRYRKLITAIEKQTDIDAAVPEDRSFYSKAIAASVRIKNRQMIDLENQMNQSAKDKNEYIEMWVHEIKIPIAVCELALGNDNQDNLEKLQLELERIKFLVNQVLYSARANDASQSLDIVEIDIQALLKNVVKANAAFFISNNNSIDFSVSSQLVVSDEKWLAYIFTQIIHNAAKHAVPGSTVYISSENKEKNLSIVVKNEGRGIPREDIPKVFDKGYVGENGRRQTKSTGMGLYLAEKAATMLDVGLSATSIDEGCVTLRVTIPLRAM